MSKKARFNLKQIANKKWRVFLSAIVSPTGEKTSKTFDTKTKAENWIAQRRRYIDKHGAEEISLTKKEMVDAKRALELLKGGDDNLHDIVREALEARDVLENADLNEGYELFLMKASRRLVEHYKQREQARTFEEVYQLSMEARGISKKTKQYQTDVGRIMTGPKYKRGQKTPKDGYKEEGFLHHYGSTLIKDITEDQVRTFMKSYYNSSGYNWNLCHRVLAPVFRYAHKRNWIGLNPMQLIDQRKTIKDRPDILTIKQFNRCIELIQAEKYRELAVSVAILMFAGLRPSELAGSQNKIPMAWDKVVMNPVGANASEPYIDVTKEHAKNKKPRLVKIVPNLVKWINTVPLSERKGDVVPGDFGALMKKFRADVGIVGMKDIFRHSFATYHYHAGENIDATMKQMGHSNRSTFENHYHAYNPEPNSPSLYWELLPEGAEKETKIVAPSFQTAAR